MGGAEVADELFGSRRALGEWVRIGDRRFRVIGILAVQGQSLGTNTDEIVIVPLAAAQALFDTESLFRILVEAKSREQIPAAQADVAEILRLPVDERLKLVEEIWDSIAATPAEVPVPDWHKAELDRRLAEPGPGASVAGDEVRAKRRRPGKP